MNSLVWTAYLYLFISYRRRIWGTCEEKQPTLSPVCGGLSWWHHWIKPMDAEALRGTVRYYSRDH